MAFQIDPEYIKARKALLDAIEVLQPHLSSIILIGAQAIYIHTGDAEFAISPFTYDTDLALNPDQLASEPKLEDIMGRAQFVRTAQPGIYKRTADGAQVDLLIPIALGGAGRRGARLGLQGNKAAMKVRGIEGALVDHKPLLVKSLDESDTRTHTIEVAGPAALLISKMLKIAERAEGAARRQDDKDAFDIFRLLRKVPTKDLAKGIQFLSSQSLSSDVTQEAITKFKQFFADGTCPGVRMVVNHIHLVEDEAIISASCVELSHDLIVSI